MQKELLVIKDIMIAKKFNNMTIDEVRIRLNELFFEFQHNKKIQKQLKKDIIELDTIMERNFDAYWNNTEQNYTQGL